MDDLKGLNGVVQNILNLTGRILPVLSIFILGVAYMRVRTYYQFFNIKIEHYLDPGEVIFIFIPYLISTIFHFSTLLIMIILVYSIVGEDEPKLRQKWRTPRFYWNFFKSPDVNGLV